MTGRSRARSQLALRALLACGSLLGQAGCSLVLPLFGYPPEALRRSAPEGIEARSTEVGAVAPALDLATAAGGRWTLAEHLAQGPAVVVFYRGDW